MPDLKSADPRRIGALEDAIIRECNRFMHLPEGKGLTIEELCRGMFHAWERVSESFLKRNKP